MMTSITVGIHVHTEPPRLEATLTAVRQPGRRPLELLLLGDGPDRALRASLRTTEIPQSVTTEALGPPACFNRLAAYGDSDVVILLESGAIPAPGALDLLIDALLADSRNGLAGPSTNLAWNEQCMFPRGLGDPVSVARTGGTATSRFGAATRELTPLHSLSDFCYAVRREVIEAIGGADEGYGLGPCWEMEYNVRAARAGFRGLWVCGAYVHRAPFTARRRIEEARRFEASRRRYQDNVCGLRLNGRRQDYEAHCRGEACEHFAPTGAIRIARPVSPAASETTMARPAAAPRQADQPLVSCVMPTRNRAELVLHAIDLFRRQDYDARELLIVDDGDDELQARLPDDPRVRYLRSPQGESIGAKRNRGCANARGSFIVHWDDDDWYGPRRLSAQLEPLIAGRAEITALRTPLFFDLDQWHSWSVTDALHRRLFVEDVHGGTLAFARHVWERLTHFPHVSLAEDAAFLTLAKARGARLQRLSGDGIFVYIRHGANAWRFTCGAFLDQYGWRRTEEPAFSPEDRAFYAARSSAAPPPADRPLVSCIMPTADRRQYVSRAITYFLRQDYPNRELIVLDDGSDRVEDLMPSDPRVRYFGLERGLVLGAKRNSACELAHGEVIAHWDDDDWQAPHRLSYQVQQLERHGAELCGPCRVLYFEPSARRAWLYEYAGGIGDWVAGNALCYRRALWEHAQFDAVAIGEDNRFVRGSRVRPMVLPDHRFLAALIHHRNASPKATIGACWHARPIAEVQSLLGNDWIGYAQ